jgi:Spy/CpxP family protein refolding chaperone
MNKFKLSVGIILIFCVGAFVGVLGTGAYFTHRFEHFTRGGHRPPIARLLMKRLTHKLDLTKAQQDQLLDTIEQTRIKLQDLREKYQPEMESIIESGIRSVKEHLTDSQKKELDEMYTRLKERWRERKTSREMGVYRTPGESFERLKEALLLTETQQAKVHEIIEQRTKDQHEIIRKYRKQCRALERSLRQEMKESRNSVENRLAVILTKEQMEKYREFEKKQLRRPYSEMHLDDLGGLYNNKNPLPYVVGPIDKMISWRRQPDSNR